MNNSEKTREQLIKELEKSKKGIAELKKSETERKRAEEAMKETYRYTRELIEANLNVLVTISAEGIITDVNSATELITGISRKELIGTDFSNYFTDPMAARKGYQQVFRDDYVLDYPLEIKHRDGKATSVLYNATVYKDREGDVAGVFASARDITERKKAEVELRKVNRALKTISECNQALIHAENEENLLNDICRIIVDFGGYRLTWIGYAEKDKQKTVRPVAQAGYEDGYLKKLNITWADTERSRGPTGTAISTGKSSIARNIFIDPNFTPWRAEATKRGYASSLALPLISGGQTFGALNIYAVEPDAFDADEVKLLTELADDLAYGIMALRMHTKHKQAEEALDRSMVLLNATGRMAKVGGWELDAETLEVRWTEETYSIHEVPLDYKPPLDKAINFYHPEDRPKLEIAIRKALEHGEPYDMEIRFITARGNHLWIRTNCKPVTVDGKTIKLIGTFQNITERKNAEEELTKHREHLEELVQERTKELDEKNKELKHFNSVFIDREFRIKELRDRVKELEKKLSGLVS